MVQESNRFTDEIGIMKYVCKEFWMSLFSKQIDNLRTNNSVFKIFKLKFLFFVCLGNFCFARQQL